MVLSFILIQNRQCVIHSVHAHRNFTSNSPPEARRA